MTGFWKPIGSAILLAACLPGAWAQQCSPHPEEHVGASVRTSSGLIKGHAAPRRPGVSEYLGIPYASPPTGDLRFAPPVAFDSEEIIEASSYVCISPCLPETKANRAPAESVCVPSLEYELQNASDQTLVTVLQTPAQPQKITLGILRRAPRS